MKKINRIPDIIIRTTTEDFVKLPREVMFNTELSPQAKGILGMLLFNKEGWCSHITTLLKMNNIGEVMIRTVLKELREQKYLIRLKYRDKTTKRVLGTIWGYTDKKENFNDLLTKINDVLAQNPNVENAMGNLDVEPEMWKPRCGAHPPNKIKSNKINLNKIKSSSSLKREEEEEETPNQTNTNQNQISIDPEKNQTSIDPENNHTQKKITPGMFEKFWGLYPRKVDKGKAKKTWERICTREKEKPSWDQIEEAIHAQIKSERWQEKEYIPHPTTWLNQTRWIDDPEEMVSQFKKRECSRPQFENGPRPSSPRFLIASHFTSQTTRKHFHKDCFDPAQELFTSDPPQKLVKPLLDLYDQINELQKKLWPSHTYHNSAPSPISLIQGYIIDLESWVTSPSLGMLSVDHKSFKDFCRKWGKSHDEYERDPITGRSYVNH